MKTRSCLIGLWMLLCQAVAPAADLVISGGLLVGARGVDVGGVLYDVDFRDGTCIELFSGCDAVSDFTFQSSALAVAASQALLSQVFLDGAQGGFDSRPSLIFGCGDSTGQGYCAVFTPVDPLVDNLVAQNASVEAGDLVKGAFTLAGENLGIYDTVVYAVWTPHLAAVPEMPAAALFALGLAAIAAVKRRAQPQPGISGSTRFASCASDSCQPR